MKRVCAIALMLCLLCGVMPTVQAAPEAVTLAAFSFGNDGAVAEEGIKDNGYGDKDTGYLATEGSGLLFASVDGAHARKLEWSKDDYSGLGMQPVMSGGAKNPWGERAYIDVKVSTLGFENITFSAKLGGTNKGPRDFKLQYSTDGLTFTDVGATYTIKDNKELEAAFDNVALPSDAANAKVLYIRMAVASNTTVNGGVGPKGTTSGETAVNDVIVRGTGDASALPTVEPGAAETDTPDAGETPPPADGGDMTLLWVGIGGAALALAAVLAVVLLRKKKSKKKDI